MVGLWPDAEGNVRQIPWPLRVAIGYGVKGVGKGGKACQSLWFQSV